MQKSETPDYHPTPEDLRKCLATIRRHQTYQGGKRFLTKLTGRSREGMLQDLFVDPRVVWIDREPEAVIMSYFKQRWFYKRTPEKFEARSKKALIEEYSNWFRMAQGEKERLRAAFPFYEVRYEDLCDDPIVFFQKLCEFLELPFSEAFRSKVASWSIHTGTNRAYAKLLDEEELAYLVDLSRPLREELGYPLE